MKKRPLDYRKTPWPWFGGKADAADAVWGALGDVAHYVEPFAGSLAVLLRRPHLANRAYHSETVNDLDGLLVNAWRAIARDPDAVADAASWPVSEADLHARHLRLLRWRSERELEHLMGDPDFCDPVMAGWWVWGQSCWIGSGWCTGVGPWVVGDDGRIVKRGKNGVNRQLPHLTNDGQGVNRPQLREEGVKRQRPHLTNNGQGVNHAWLREEGVNRQRPHLANNGRGVNHAGLREEGVEFHEMTMPELRAWMRYLSARLRHVRILNGSWERACTSGALKTLSVRQNGGVAGVFLDPPYTSEVRDDGLYAVDDGDVAHAVRQWCIENGADSKCRIVLAGFAEEHGDLEAHGWRAVEWFRKGYLKGGMANQGRGGTSQHRERLWLSPHCIGAEAAQTAQLSMVAAE